MCFVRISEQTAIISLYSFNWLVFITETESDYCAVRAEGLENLTGFNGRAMAQAVSSRPLIAEVLVRSRYRPRDISERRNGLRHDFLRVISSFAETSGRAV